MKSSIENAVKQLSLYLHAVKNTASPADQPSLGIKSARSIKCKVDRNNFIKAIAELRGTVKLLHQNILNHAKPNNFQDKLKTHWGQGLHWLEAWQKVKRKGNNKTSGIRNNSFTHKTDSF